MCGRLSGMRTWQEMRDWYRLLPSEPLKRAGIEPADMIAPASQQPIIRFVPNQYVLDVATWGFPPRKGKGRPPINARCETMHVLPSFRTSFLRYRCAVPVTGYYEWKREVDGSRSLWRFSINAGTERGAEPALFALAGLFMVDHATRQRRFVVVTTEANDVAAEIHERMPVILDATTLDIWLVPDTPPGPLRQICHPYNGSGFAAESVQPPLAAKQPKHDPRQHQLNF
jgi:putative SOS response-associated peptidase YedK